MSDNRYSELKYDGKIYTSQWQINEILIKNKFNWMVDAEIKNARLEISQDTLVWNAGIWYNGDWYFGVWRDGEWRYGTWQNGVWYNGTWRDGTFKSGIIYKGRFFKGKMLDGEIRGGQFIDMTIDPKVVEYTGEEFQAKKQAQTEQPSTSGQTTTVTAKATMQPTGQTAAQSVIQVQPEDRVKVSGTKPPVQKLQQEKNNYQYMKKYVEFINEELNMQQDQQFFTKLLQSYKFQVFIEKNNRQDIIKNITSTYEKGVGVLPNGLQGVAIISFHDNTSGVIELVSSNKVLIKQIIDKTNENWSKFSSTENKQVGHKTSGGWNEQETNLGSKGTQMANKSGITTPEYLKWKNKEGVATSLFLGTVTLM